MSPVLSVRPPLAKVAFATAIVYGITATLETTVPAHLSTSQVAWLVKPWLGAYIHTFQPSSLPSAAMFVGTAGLLLILVAFYVEHCVVDQPLWAVLGGWAPMLSGLTLLQMQSAFGGWWVSVDINRFGFPLAYCESFVGVAVVATSWVVAPDLFNPRLARPWVAAIIAGILVSNFALSAVNAPATVDNLVIVITVGAGLIVGSRLESRKMESTDRPSDNAAWPTAGSSGADSR
jgi:hypothetical protein